MLTCRETTYLISQSFDRKLNLGQRLAIRTHLLMCRFCSRFNKQLKLIRAFTNYISRKEQSDHLSGLSEESLSPEARNRIMQSIQSDLHKH